jgi:predicted secreted protein
MTDKEILVTAHCLQNPFTRVKGLKGPAFRLEGPTIQLPCPEALYLGLDRWAVTKNQLDVPEFRRFCQSLIANFADLLEMLAHQGVRLKVIGIAGSPSCGVATTSNGYTGGLVQKAAHTRVKGRGVFMEELLAELERRKVAFQVAEAVKNE